jgi:hypothetical protein
MTAPTTPTNVGADASRGHTPGPWEVVGLSGIGGPFAIRMAYNSEKTFYGVRQIHRREDANLIAAAPKMRTTLEKLERWFDTDAEIVEAMDAATRADHERQLRLIRDALTPAGEQK